MKENTSYIINNRNHYVLSSKGDSYQKKEQENSSYNSNTYKNYKSYTNPVSTSNSNIKVSQKLTPKPEPVSSNKNYISSIPTSSKASINVINTKDNKNESNRNHIKLSSNNERSYSTQKYSNYVKTEPTVTQRNQTIIIDSPRKRTDISKDKDDKNNSRTYIINVSNSKKSPEKENKNDKFRAKSIDRVVQNNSRRNNINIISQNKNISDNKDKDKNKNETSIKTYNNVSRTQINVSTINSNNNSNSIIQRKNSSNNSFIMNNKEKKDTKEIDTSNKYKSHTITIIPKSDKNDKANERVYISKPSQKQENDKNDKKVENANQNVGITFISNVTMSKYSKVTKK